MNVTYLMIYDLILLSYFDNQNVQMSSYLLINSLIEHILKMLMVIQIIMMLLNHKIYILIELLLMDGKCLSITMRINVNSIFQKI